MNDQPNNERRALRAAVAQQQGVIQSQASLLQQQGQALEMLRQAYVRQGAEIDYIAGLAGVSRHIAAIRGVTADIENPAQPVPNPPEQPPHETTEQAATPEAYDSPLNPGQTPGSVQHLPADATGTPMDPGATLPTAPFNDLQEVTAPVSGTQSGEVPLEQVRTEVDVRVGDPMNLERAFPWTMSPDRQGGSPKSGEFGAEQRRAASLEQPEAEPVKKAASAQNRTLASLRLARLQIQAGIADGEDDLSVSASIEADESRTDHDIAQEINTLSTVVQKAASRSQRPAGVVPRTASVQRTTPSLVQTPLQAQAAGSQGLGDLDDTSDLFD